MSFKLEYYLRAFNTTRNNLKIFTACSPFQGFLQKHLGIEINIKENLFHTTLENYYLSKRDEVRKINSFDYTTKETFIKYTEHSNAGSLNKDIESVEIATFGGCNPLKYNTITPFYE